MPTATRAAPQVSGGIDPNLFARALAPALGAALEELGETETAAIKLDLSVPVVHTGTGQTIRSSPGEPPRRDEGVLRANVEHVTLREGDFGMPVLEIMSNRPPREDNDQWDAAVILEFGGVSQSGRTIEPRPYMRPSLERLRKYAAGFLSRVLRV